MFADQIWKSSKAYSTEYEYRTRRICFNQSITLTEWRGGRFTCAYFHSTFTKFIEFLFFFFILASWRGCTFSKRPAIGWRPHGMTTWKLFLLRYTVFNPFELNPGVFYRFGMVCKSTAITLKPKQPLSDVVSVRFHANYFNWFSFRENVFLLGMYFWL